MEITIREEENTVCLILNGKLDGSTAGDFEKTVFPLVCSASVMVLDCTGLTYVSSAGLRSILGAIRKAKASGVTLSLRGLSDTVRETFLLSGFGPLVTLEG